MNRKKIENLILKAFISTAVAFSVAVAVPNFTVNKNCNFSLITASKVYADAITSQNNTKTISAGNSSFAVKTDGTLWACGLNNCGQLGDGTTTNKSVWEQVGSNFSQVVSSGGHSLALKTDGTLWACGYNSNGQLGDGTTTNKPVWEQVGSGFSQIACGSNHSLALKADGTLYACGLNSSGQLGDGTTTDKPVWENVGSGFSQVACGSNHSLALKTDGTLWACGYNGYGELGDNSTVNKSSWEQVGTNFSQIACGTYHSLALKTDGTLYGCGYDAYGELGDNSTSNKSSWEQVGFGFSQIACGEYSSMALKSDSTLLACGYNSYGNLGDGTEVNKSSWEQVGFGFSKVSVGDCNSLATKEDGTLYACGYNPYGELGDGTTTTSTMFKQVLTGVANNSEDKTAPQITLSQDTDSWTNNKVTISVSASDDGTGVDKIQTPDGTWVSSDSTTYNVTANGTYTFKAADKAGNEASKSITINNIDTTAPGAPGINLDQNKLTIIGGSDSKSGVKETDYQLNNGAWIKYTDPVTLDDGSYTINARTIDNAGNSSVIVTTEANVNKNPTVNAVAISLDKSSDSIEIGQTDTLTASITPTNTSNKNVKWTSSDSSVASVDQSGKVTAVKAGTAVITVSTQDGTNLSASCTVNVQDNQTVTLILNFVDNTSKTYEISQDEFNDFMGWYYAETEGESDQPGYSLNVPATKYSKAKKVYIMFSRIISVEVE